MRRVVVGVHRHVGLDPFECRNHAGERADVLAEARHRVARRNGAVSAAGHDQPAAGVKLDRYRSAARIAHLLAAATGTLRPRRHVMLRNFRAQEIEADDVIAQVRRKTRGDRLRDFDGCKLDSMLSEWLLGEGRSRHDARVAAVEHSPDLAVAPHAIGKTGPAGALVRSEHRPHQWKNAGGLHQQPGCAIRQMPLVQLSQACVEIIAHQHDGQIGRALHDANAEPAQRGGKLLCTQHVDRLNADAAGLETIVHGLR